MQNEPIILKNANPTEAEKKLYEKGAYYLIESDFCEVNGRKTNLPYHKYAYVGNMKPGYFPESIKVSTTDFDFTIAFESLSEQIEIKGPVDAGLLSIVLERAKELKWSSVTEEV